MLSSFSEASVVVCIGKIGGRTPEKWRDRLSKFRLADTMHRMRSKDKWLFCRARRVRNRRFVWNIGEDHLKGVFCSVIFSNLGNDKGVPELAQGSHCQSV